MPWMPDEVYRLNRRQESPGALACPGHPTVPLFATRWGWICAASVGRRACSFRQDWTARADVEAWVSARRSG